MFNTYYSNSATYMNTCPWLCLNSDMRYIKVNPNYYSLFKKRSAWFEWSVIVPHHLTALQSHTKGMEGTNSHREQRKNSLKKFAAVFQGH